MLDEGISMVFLSPVFPCEQVKMTPDVFQEFFSCLGNIKDYILRQMRFKNTTKIVARRQGPVRSIKPTAPGSGRDL